MKLALLRMLLRFFRPSAMKASHLKPPKHLQLIVTHGVSSLLAAPFQGPLLVHGTLSDSLAPSAPPLSSLGGSPLSTAPAHQPPARDDFEALWSTLCHPRETEPSPLRGLLECLPASGGPGAGHPMRPVTCPSAYIGTRPRNKLFSVRETTRLFKEAESYLY